MGRKIFAHLYDTIIFVVVQVVILKIVDAYIYNNDLSPIYTYLIVIPIFLLFCFLLYGAFANAKQASIGQYIEKLIVYPTKGKLTTFRMFIKNFLALSVYYPLLIFIFQLTIVIDEMQIKEAQDILEHLEEINLDLLTISVVVILLNAIINLYLHNKFDQSFTDRAFDVKSTIKKQKQITFEDFSKISKTKNN